LPLEVRYAIYKYLLNKYLTPALKWSTLQDVSNDPDPEEHACSVVGHRQKKNKFTKITG